MKKVSFRVRNFDEEQFLTYNIDNEADLDEDVLDFIEEEEPKGIVPIIFEEEEEFDTFSYDITEKIRLSELSNQDINAEMVLMVVRGLMLALLDMTEYRIPVSYLVLNRDYIYINSEYEVEFVCIPLNDMKEDVDLSAFFRNFVASLRYDPSENGDYVAKLLSFINNSAMFNLRMMVSLVENLMVARGIEVPEDSSADIYGEYEEVKEDDIPEYEAQDSEEIMADMEDESAEEVLEETERMEEDFEDASSDDMSEDDVDELAEEILEGIMAEATAYEPEENALTDNVEEDLEELTDDEMEPSEEFVEVIEETEQEEMVQEEPDTLEEDSQDQEPVARFEDVIEIMDESDGLTGASEETDDAHESEDSDDLNVSNADLQEETEDNSESDVIDITEETIDASTNVEEVVEEPMETSDQEESTVEEPGEPIEKEESTAKELSEQEESTVEESAKSSEQEESVVNESVDSSEKEEDIAPKPVETSEDEKAPTTKEKAGSSFKLKSLDEETKKADVEEVKEPEPEETEEETPEDNAGASDNLIANLKKKVVSVMDTVSNDVASKEIKKPALKTKNTVKGVVIQDELDEYLAEKEHEAQQKQVKHADIGLKIKKDVKVNRASLVKSGQEEVKVSVEPEAETEVVTEVEAASAETAANQNDTTVATAKTTPVPKVNPYLIRVNTEERIMITKQNFKIGKAGMGVDYTVKGNGAVSRVHAIIINKEETYYIKDNKSTNHTFVNGKAIEEGQSEELLHDCIIILGDEEFIFKLS